MKLYFESSDNSRRFLANCPTREEVFAEIKKFLDEHNFKSYYYRVTRHGDEVHIDVGSWSEFFIVIDKERVFEDED